MEQVPQHGTRPRFRFIDLLAVVFVIAVAFAVMILSVMVAMPKSVRMQCKNNMKEVGTAIKVFESQSQCLPYIEQRNNAWPSGTEFAVHVSLFYQMLSCIDEGDVANLPYYYAPAGTQSSAQTKISAFQCPSDPSAGVSATSKQGPGGSTDCPIAMSNYVLNYSIFRGNKDTRLTSKDVMEAQASTIIMGERLQFCTLDASGKPKPQVWWADPTATMFWVAGVDNTGSGKPIETVPPGMEVQTGTSYRNCRLPPPVGQSMPAGTYFQSAHPAQVNVLRGDAGVTQIISGFSAQSLNYWCLGIGRSAWIDSVQPPSPLP